MNWDTWNEVESTDPVQFEKGLVSDQERDQDVIELRERKANEQ